MSFSFGSVAKPGPLLDVVSKGKSSLSLSWGELPGSTGQDRGEKLDQEIVVDPIIGQSVGVQLPSPTDESMPDA